MLQALSSIELLSSVKAASVSADIAHLKPSSSIPTGTGADLAALLRAKFNRCDSDYSRLLVLKDAQQIVSTTRYAPDKAYRRGTLEWKLAIAQDERISVEVACAYGVSSSYVRALRSDLHNGRLGAKKRAA